MAYVDKDLIKVAQGKQPADVLVRGGKLVNVYTREVYLADVAIAKGRIAAIGDVGYCQRDSTEIIDAEGMYLVPGLIDSHIHPEVSKITITRMANAAVPRGTTSIMCALDQIGVVAGMEGMRSVLDEVKNTPLKIFHSCPSRLPYTTPASTIAHRFGPEEHDVAQDWEEAVGIWEFMSTSVVDFDEMVLGAADLALNRRLRLHGHAPVTRGKILSACVAAGMNDDHESYSAEELAEKMSLGVYSLIRRGTHSDNFPECIKAITEMGLPADRIALCTDDLDCMDIVELGLIDYIVRYTIRLGVDPITAIQMGSLHAAEAYGVDHMVGSITPGLIADILLVSDLEEFVVDAVIADGTLVARDRKMLAPIASPSYPEFFKGTVHLNQPITEKDLYLQVEQDAESANILCMHMDLTEGLLNRRRDVVLPVEGGRVLADPAQDALYISVTERHTGDGKTSSAFISGFGLQRGAIATSLSPDDDNIICVGASVDDMVVAINHLAKIGGGQVAVESGKVAADIPLPLCGLMADISAEEMAGQERALNEAAYELGTQLTRPFFFLIFLSITAIPEFAMTDMGLVSHETRAVIDPVLGLNGGQQ